MKRQEKYLKSVKKVADLISDNPLSASQIADKVGLTKVTVYTHIEYLKQLGFDVVERSKRIGLKGPKATTYEVVGLTDLGAFY